MKIIRPSIAGYIYIFILFSPFMIVIPLWMGVNGYVDSGYWKYHLAMVPVMLGWFVYLYQELIITEEGIERYIIRFIFKKKIYMAYKDMAAWEYSNPIRIYDRRNDVLLIPWTMLKKEDRKLLVDRLKQLKLPTRKLG